MPRVSSSSMNLGRMPVATYSPWMLPSASVRQAPETEDLVHGDDIALHAGDLVQADQAAPAVAHALELNDHVKRRGDLAAHRANRHLEARHADHLLDAAERVAAGVGVDRGHRALVAGVHGLQHVEGLSGAHLADDDPVRAHAQGVLDQLALADLALAFDIRSAGSRGAPRESAAFAARRRPRWSRCARGRRYRPTWRSAGSSCRCPCRRR